MFVRKIFDSLLVLALVVIVVGGSVVGIHAFIDYVQKPVSAPALAPSPSPTPDVPPAAFPDMSRILPLIGAASMGHGCPVTPSVALTARHVVYEEELGEGMWPRMFSTASGMTSIAYPTRADRYRDLSAAVLLADVEPYYLAAKPPLPGDVVFWRGFDYRTQADFYAPRNFYGKVLRIVAGYLVIDRPAIEGSSGSCILNARGEVVGIVTWRLSSEDQKGNTMGPGTWSNLVSDLLEDVEEDVQRVRASW